MENIEHDRKKNTGLIMIAVILGIATIALAIVLHNTKQENTKLNTILDMACNYSNDRQLCREGIEIIKGMNIDQIKTLRRY